MSIIIGGSGSSGTTLLKTILDNHPDIYSGPELSFFNKEKLYKNWNHYKWILLDRSLSIPTDGWFPYASHELLHAQYGWSAQELEGLVRRSETILSFVNQYFERSCKRHHAKIWIEKTPSNTYGFKDFLSLSDQHRVIHLFRNPYDTVTSLVKRGMTPYFAAGLWVYNNSAGLAASVSCPDRYYALKYEDLLQFPQRILDDLFRFIGTVPLDIGCLFDSRKAQGEGLTTWGNNPGGQLSKSSIGSFGRQPVAMQDLVVAALDTFKIRSRVAVEHGLPVATARELCIKLGYDYRETKQQHIVRNGWDLAKDFLSRSVRGYSTGWFGYPGAIKIL